MGNSWSSYPYIHIFTHVCVWNTYCRIYSNLLVLNYCDKDTLFEFVELQKNSWIYDAYSVCLWTDDDDVNECAESV